MLTSTRHSRRLRPKTGNEPRKLCFSTAIWRLTCGAVADISLTHSCQRRPKQVFGPLSYRHSSASRRTSEIFWCRTLTPDSVSHKQRHAARHQSRQENSANLSSLTTTTTDYCAAVCRREPRVTRFRCSAPPPTTANGVFRRFRPVTPFATSSSCVSTQHGMSHWGARRTDESTFWRHLSPHTPVCRCVCSPGSVGRHRFILDCCFTLATYRSRSYISG